MTAGSGDHGRAASPPEPPDAVPLDLEAYLARIGAPGPWGPTLESLRALHSRHARTIPFENVDVRLGRPIALDLASLEAKLVRGGRGGYCFEQNTLFCAALRALGFHVETLEARVRPAGATAVLGRTHMLLRASSSGRSWLADVGFGGDGPSFPVPMDGTTSPEEWRSYRVVPEGPLAVLQLCRGGEWTGLYAFGPEPALPVDYEVASHYTSTHPRSTFVRSLTVQVHAPGERRVLRGRRYTVSSAGGVTEVELPAARIPALLAEAFGLGLPEEDVLAAVGDA